MDGEVGIRPISLKHSPTSGEDQGLRSVSCPRGPLSSMTRRQASRIVLNESTANVEDACQEQPLCRTELGESVFFKTK